MGEYQRPNWLLSEPQPIPSRQQSSLSIKQHTCFEDVQRLLRNHPGMTRERAITQVAKEHDLAVGTVRNYFYTGQRSEETEASLTPLQRARQRVATECAAVEARLVAIEVEITNCKLRQKRLGVERRDLMHQIEHLQRSLPNLDSLLDDLQGFVAAIDLQLPQLDGVIHAYERDKADNHAIHIKLKERLRYWPEENSSC